MSPRSKGRLWLSDMPRAWYLPLFLPRVLGEGPKLLPLLPWMPEHPPLTQRQKLCELPGCINPVRTGKRHKRNSHK